VAKLTYRQRKRLAEKHPELFVFPPTPAKPLGGYPIDTAARARDALSRVSRFGTDYEQKEVCKAVARMWPNVHAESCPLHLRAR